MPDPSTIATEESASSLTPRSSHPTIAVVVAGRNAADWVGHMLESLAVQTVPPDEVVFYDDASTDGTRAVVEGFRDRLPALTILGGDEPVGIAAARNRGNAAATSDCIAVLDADDFFAPDAIRHYHECLAEHPEADLLYADTVVFHEDPAQGRERRYPALLSGRPAVRRTLASPLLPLKHSSVLYSRRAMAALGGYDESYPIKVDVELFLRFLARGRTVVKLDRVTSYHRKHRSQISTRRLDGLVAYRRLLRAYEPNPLVRLMLRSIREPSEFLKYLLRG
ncbi:MAG: glycosyltransferase [Verrucomicrobiales bacterium]